MDTLVLISQIIGGISNLGIFVVAIVALKQIHIARQETRIRSQREASNLSIAIAEKFYSRTTANEFELTKLLNQNGLKQYAASSNFKYDNVDAFTLDGANQYLAQVKAKSTDSFEKMIIIANDLEVIANSILSGIADEETAYAMIGADFCSFVDEVLPVLLLDYNKKNKPMCYAGVFDLCKRWTAKYQGQVAKQVKAIAPINPIGTDAK